QVENYVLLLVLLSVFAGGTLVLLSLLLLFCHRCCMGGRRYSRWVLPTERHIGRLAGLVRLQTHGDYRSQRDYDSSGLNCHDGESERFVSTGSTGRRVSFNESALYEQEKTTQNKGRRYTLTEGDFHHLKKARLTHLHLPPAPCDLKILTIMECDSAESSTINISETAAPKLGGLPGDPHHSIVLDQGPRQMEAIGDRGEAESERGMRGELTQAPGQTSVLHFFSKLRRHASLEGAGPYFRRWKFDSSHRAASLDAKGSPKRRPFQRQRAASETTDHTDDDSLTLQDESFPHTPILSSGLQSLSAEADDGEDVVLGAEARQRADSGSSLSFMIRQESSEAPPSLYRDIWSLRASLEQYASSDQSSTDRESIRSDADSVSSLGGAGARASGGDSEMGSGAGGENEAGNRKLLQMDSGYASIESIPQPSSPHRPRLRRRDYSIDEKTDALFNEFLRHDPRFDQQDSPLRSRHRSRVHLRKQWQRHKQYSDPGSGTGGRYSPSLERQRFTPLRRGDSAGYPLDTRYHSTLSRIASAADEEASEVAAGEEAAKESTENKDPSSEGAAGDNTESAANKTCEGTDAKKSSCSCTGSGGEGNGCQVSPNKDTESTTSQSLTTVTAKTSHMDPRVDNRNNNSSQAILSEVSLQAEDSLSDKLVVSVEERLYGGLRSAEELGQGGSEHVLTVSHTASPGFSPI
uniref:Voltage-dependent calcium channel beta subunit-associated regulatory protein-like n=1 Tax=Seriola dumerili TaxID=41447 RepID=A0A3B4UUF7_SERDU